MRGILFNGFSDATAWILQVLMILIGAVIDIFKENQEKKRFQRFYAYRESLTKFKDLMIHGLPSRLLILSRDLKEEFFSNEPLQTTVRKSILRKEGKMEMLHEWLGQLIIDKKTFSKTIRDSVQLDKQTMSVGDFIQAFVEKEHCLEDKKQRITFTAEYSDPVTGIKNVYDIHFFAMIWDSKESIALIISDVTERFMNASLKVANANKDKMLAMISHELRTPLNGILGVVNILEKQTKEPQTVQYISLCKNNGELLLNLVNSILDLQQIRDNKFSLKITRYNLYDLLKGVIQLFKFQFEQKNVELLLKISEKVPQFIASDQDRLRQILINLIGNAFKFTFEGKVVVAVEPCSEGSLQFKIADTGLGIKEDDKSKLFQMYGRLTDENSNAVNTQGVGFGLEISNQLATLLAQDSEFRGIQFESEYGKGSTFSFLIQDFQRVGHDHNLENTDLSFDEPRVFAEEIENISIKMSPYATSLQFGSERETVPRSSFLSNMPSRFSSAQHLPPILKRSAYSDRYINQSPLSKLGKQNKQGFATLASSQRTSLYLKLSNVGLLSSSAASQTDEARSESSILNPAGDLSPNKSHTTSDKSEKPRALIIDDNPFNLLVAKHLVEGLGFTVETALNGKLGVEFAEAAYVTHKKPFKLVLMDLQMPVMDGYEATKVLRKMIADKEIPELHIIAVSANDSEDDKSRSKGVGMDGHLSKPLNEKELKEILEKISSENDEDNDSSISGSSFGKID